MLDLCQWSESIPHTCTDTFVKSKKSLASSLQTDRTRQVVSYQLHLCNNNTSLLSSTPQHLPLQTPNKMGCSSSKPATGPKSATASSTKKAAANKEGKKFDSDYKRGSTVSFILTTSSDDGERVGGNVQ